MSYKWATPEQAAFLSSKVASFIHASQNGKQKDFLADLAGEWLVRFDVQEDVETLAKQLRMWFYSDLSTSGLI
ncbi:hypothetical protein VKT23_010252 [Stygiomarasmius scandens]|uniref:Uncharacterized protein n=1 Tax=Marasmiellus scandens TaxID=2682957 RepID=A0ABR1JF71_9AGAR